MMATSQEKIYDLEIFPNLFLAVFLDPETKTFDTFEYFGDPDKIQDTAPLELYLASITTLIGFNSQGFDNKVIKEFLKKKTIRSAKAMSDGIIGGQGGEDGRREKPERLVENDIDVLGVLDRKGGLKLFAARIGFHKILECACPFGQDISETDRAEVIEYCKNDVLATLALWQHKATQGKYRSKTTVSEVYQMPLQSSTEAEIGSAVIASEIKRERGIEQYASLQQFCSPVFDFYGKDVINPAITFDTPALQTALQSAKDFHFTKASVEGRGASRFHHSLEVGGIKINIGQGGLHSIGKSAIILELKDDERLIDHDVASFYPNMLVAENIAPGKLVAEFFHVYIKIKESRMAAKKAGDKPRADCEKIILNSTFGKFGDKYSWMYNPKNMAKVTMNCQFRLLEIVDKIAVAKIEILQINTDGVLCRCKNKEEERILKDIVHTWELNTTFQMEETGYLKLVMKDTNNYLAVTSDGKVKEKGSFVTERSFFGGGKIPIVLTKAVRAFFLEGRDVEDTISNNRDILDFCLFAKRAEWVQGGIEGVQPNVNRWIWGCCTQNKLVSKTAKMTKTDDTNVKLANDLDDVALDDIDLDRYVQTATDMIEGILVGKGTKAVKKAREGHDKPKRGKAKPPANQDFNFDFDEDALDIEIKNIEVEGVKDQLPLLPLPVPTTPPSSWGEWIAFYRGLSFPILVLAPNKKMPVWNSWQTISKEETWVKAEGERGNIGIRDDDLAVIDVDNPEKAASLFPNIHINNAPIVFRTGKDPCQISEFKEKGHIYFKRPTWLTETLQIKDDEGKMVMELRVGNKVQCVAPPSLHPDGSLYQWYKPELLTCLPEFPKNLYDEFIKHIPEKKTYSHKKPKSGADARKEEIKAFITIRDILKMFDVIVKSEGGYEYILCLWHVDKGRPNCQVNDPELDLPPLHCYTCGADKDIFDAYMALAKCDFKTAFAALDSLTPKTEPIEGFQYPEYEYDDDGNGGSPAQEMPEITSAFEVILSSAGKCFSLSAPTGSGKTSATAKLVADRIRNKRPVLYCANQKNDLFQFFESLSSLLDEQEKKSVQVICRDTENDIEKGTIAVLTHKTYLTRKGFSLLHYSPLLWIHSETLVVIDEAQSYIRNQTRKIYAGCKYAPKAFRDHGIVKKPLLKKCPSFTGSGNCLKCETNAQNFLAPNSTGILEIHSYIQGRTGSDFVPFSLPYPPASGEAHFRCFSVESLVPRQKPLNRHYRSSCTASLDADRPDFAEIWDDLFVSAFRPKRYTFSPIDKETEDRISADTLKACYAADEGTEGKWAVQKNREEIKSKYSFPAAPCEVPNYDFQDTSSLTFIYKNAEKVILLGATLREDEKEFLKFCATDTQFIEIKESTHKIDELAVFISLQKIEFLSKKMGVTVVTIQPILDAIPEGKRALVFEAKKRVAEKLYSDFPRNYPVAILNGDDITINERHENKPRKISITWELGPLGIAVNRPDDYLAIIDGACYLPIVAYGHDETITKEKVKDGYRHKAEDTLVQCGGRILRGTGRKAIILHNAKDTLPNIDTIREKWQGMVATEISILVVIESQEYLLDSVCNYFKNGEMPKENEKSFVERKKEEAEDSKQAQKDDENTRKRVEKLITKGLKMKKEGKCWREICRDLNMNRYKGIEEVVRQKLGF